MIDAHIHIFPRYRSVKAVRWLKKHIPSLEVQETVDESDILNKLEDCGISWFFNYVYPLGPDETEFLNRFNHELSRRVPNAVCFGSIHPENEDKEEIVRRAIVDLDLLGLKFHPFVQGFNILDERMDEVYRTFEGFLVKEAGTETYRVFFNYPLKDIEQYSTRVLVGSDYPVGMNSPERIYEHIRMLPVSEETMRDISADTAKSFVERFKPGFFDRVCA